MSRDGFVARRRSTFDPFVSSGTVNVTGANSIWTNSGSLYVGGGEDAAGGMGTVNVTDGGRVNVGDTLLLWPDGRLDVGFGEDENWVDIGTPPPPSGVMVLENRVAVWEDGTLAGSGQARGVVRNFGTVAPGTSVGTLLIDGGYQQGESGTLQIEIAGTGAAEFDRLEILGGIAWLLGGTLDVSILPGYTPTVGDLIEILAAEGGVSGTFSTLNLPAAANGHGLLWDVHYNPNDITLEIIGILPGDYNGNGLVDAADYTVWRDTLGSTTDLRADGNGNDVIDPGDYDVWKMNFGATAGSGASAVDFAAVPEPNAAAIFLALIAGLGLSTCRQLRRAPSSRERIRLRWRPSAACRAGDGRTRGGAAVRCHPADPAPAPPAGG